MGISLAGVTGAGMEELFVMGNWTRQRYIVDENEKFIGSHFNSAHVYVQAVSEDRTIQSAVAWSQGMYPPHTSTPSGYNKHMPAPVPVYTLLDKHDNLLETRKALCKNRLAYDSNVYDVIINADVLAENSDLIHEIEEICQVKSLDAACVGSGDNIGDAIKDITDAMMFDYMSGFTPMKGLTFDLLRDFRHLAVKQLLGRIVGSDDQITYMNGELPKQLIANFDAAIQGGIKLTAYHAHRELLYSMAAFLEIEFDIPFPGMPRGAIPPATTIFLELHQHDSELYVETYLWTPCYPLEHHKLAPIHTDCPAHRIYMKSCGKLCSYQKFQSLITDKIASTGSYIDLCAPYNIPSNASVEMNSSDETSTRDLKVLHDEHTSKHHRLHQHDHSSKHHSHNHHRAKQTHVWPWLVGFGVGVVVLVTVAYAYTQYTRRRQYQLLDDSEYPTAE